MYIQCSMILDKSFNGMYLCALVRLFIAQAKVSCVTFNSINLYYYIEAHNILNNYKHRVDFFVQSRTFQTEVLLQLVLITFA